MILALGGTLVDRSGILESQSVFVIGVIAASIIHLTSTFIDKTKLHHKSEHVNSASTLIDDTGLGQAYQLSGVAKYLHVFSVIGLTVCSVATFFIRDRGAYWVLFFIIVLIAFIAIINIVINRRRAAMNYDLIVQPEPMHYSAEDSSGDIDI